MSRPRLELPPIAGLRLRVDPLWAIVGATLAWSLAAGLLPAFAPGLETGGYLALSVAGVAALFGSLLLHELAHAWMARQYGLRTRSVTLYPFGGVADLAGEPGSPEAELMVALAGPVASLATTLAALAAAVLVSWIALSQPLVALLWFVALVNGLLGFLNLLPAPPLDGGRALAAVLWRLRGDRETGRRAAATFGFACGLAALAAAVLGAISRNPAAGLLWAALGLFLIGSSRAAGRLAGVRSRLAGEPIGRFAAPPPALVPRALSVAQAAREYLHRYRGRVLPVVDGERFLGLVDQTRLRALPRAEWERQTIGTLALPPLPGSFVSPEMDALEVLERMLRSGLGNVLVVDGEQLLGLASLDDLVRGRPDGKRSVHAERPQPPVSVDRGSDAG